MCRPVLNTLSDHLYDLYMLNLGQRNLKCFGIQIQSRGGRYQKISFSKYFEFKFNDYRYFLAQVHELYVIVNLFRYAGIQLLISFRAIITRLPTSWKGYRKIILHDSKEFSLEEIQKHLRIEEDRGREKNKNSYNGNNKANTLNKSSKKSNKENQMKENSLGPKKDQNNSRSLN